MDQRQGDASPVETRTLGFHSRDRRRPDSVIPRSSLVILLLWVLGAPLGSGQSDRVDPLPSWNDGPAEKAILEFVARVTKEGGPDFVPPAERIATFDNDGTLWSEQPI